MSKTEKILREKQKQNLEFLEQWSESLPKVGGVDVVRCLNYELIQIMNGFSVEAFVEDPSLE